MVAVPFQLGQYKVIGQVGAGGFATVYRAKIEGDMGFSRDVALKVLHPHITSESPDVVAMLADEARLLSRMQHPNIVYVQWFGRMANPEGGELFGMTMEYVEGRSWRSLLDEVRRSAEEVPLSVVLDVHTDIARALEFAHGLTGDDGAPLGLVHRDLKPDNIMVSSRGVVKLLDFGIAKARDRLAKATETDMVRGTVHYMSPEQVYGVKDLDLRSDLFSFGAMLFEALVGARMIESDTVIPAIREIVGFDTAQALERASEIHPDLKPLLGKLLCKEREGRFASASELVEALVRVRGSVEAEQPTTAWLAARAKPIADTVAIETPPGLSLSETVAIDTGGTTAEQVPPPAGTETRPVAPAAAAAPAAPRSNSPVLIGAILVLLGILAGTVLPGLLAPDPVIPPGAGSEPAADPVVEPVEPAPAVAPEVEEDPATEEDGVASLDSVAAVESAVEPEVAARPEPNERASGGASELASKPAAAVAPPEPVVAAPGTVRLAADRDFSVSLAGKGYTQLEARKGISLPPGTYTASFTCLSCPDGVSPTASLRVTVESDRKVVGKVVFEASP